MNKCSNCGKLYEEEFDFCSNKCKRIYEGNLIQNLAEANIGQIYDRDELYACSDWVAEEENTQFFCTIEGVCVRTEKDDIKKEKLVVKMFFKGV